MPQKKSNKERASQFKFFRQENPLSGLDAAQRDELFHRLAESASEEFDSGLQTLKKFVTLYDPLHLVSLLVSYGLSRALSDQGVIERKTVGGEIQQAHIELAQALALSVPDTAEKEVLKDPAKVQEFWDALIAVQHSFAAQRFSQFKSDRSREEKAIILLQEHVRAQTQFTRNWGHYSQSIRIALELSSKVDREFLCRKGYGLTKVVSFFQLLGTIIDRRLSERMERLQRAFRPKTVRRIIESYPGCRSASEVQAMLKFARERMAKPSQVKQMILQYEDSFITEIHLFIIGSLVERMGIERSYLDQIIDRFSLPLNALNGYPDNHLFLGNPIWDRPIIRISDEVIYCAFPQVFLSNFFRISDAEAKSCEMSERWSGSKSEFLEDAVEKLFRSSFVGAQVQRSMKWKDSEVEYETDLLCRVDNYLFVVECKSGSVSESALRGAPSRLKRHIEELIVDPAIQSKRLEQAIGLIGTAKDLTNLSEVLEISLREVSEIIRISVALEDLAAIQSQLKQVEDTGWFGNALELPLTFSLGDLEVVLEILPTAAQKIHYLARRSFLSRKSSVLGDEIDWLGLYLETGFDLPIEDEEFGSMVITGTSKKVDSFYIAKANGINVKVPRLEMPNAWVDVTAKIEERVANGWSKIAVAMLSVPADHQKELLLLAAKLRKKVKRLRERAGSENALIYRSESDSYYAYGILALTRDNYRDRRDHVTQVAAKVFDLSDTEVAVILVYNVDAPVYPYNMFAVLNRSGSSE